jgi:hypothetical protein
MLRTLAFAVLTVGGLWLLWRVLLVVLRRALMRSILANRPRPQTEIFLYRLREFVFKNPRGARQILLSESAPSVVRKIWDDSKPPPQQRVGEPALRPDGLAVHAFDLTDGRLLVVVTTPPPQRNHEPYLAAVVFPNDALFASDPVRARAITRFFWVTRGSDQYGRETDLRGYTADGDERWYNVGAPTDAPGFAKAIVDKMNELKL